MRKKTITAKSNITAKDKNPLSFYAVIICTFLFGFSTNYIGKLFYGDIAIIAVGFILSLKVLIDTDKEALRLLIMMMCVCLYFCALDFINQIPQADIFRGIARNLVFIAAIICGLNISRWYGLKKSIIIILLVGLAPSWAAIFSSEGIAITEIQILVKFYGLGCLALLLLLYVPVRIIQIVYILSLSLTIGFVLDSRAGGAVLMGSAVLFLMSRVIAKIRKRNFVMIGCVSSIFLIPSVITGFTLDRDMGWVTTRQEFSNNQRYMLAQSAIEGIKENPFIGQGSWQHARQYLDQTIRQLDEVVGVHSYALQFGFEYGIMGIAVGVSMAILGLAGIWNVAVLYSKKIVTSNIAIIGIYLSLLVFYGVLFSPFAGYSRIAVGLICGLLIDLQLTNIKNSAVGFNSPDYTQPAKC